MSGIPESLRSMYAHDATVLTGIENGSVRWIPLNKGYYTILDADDYDRIIKSHWWVQVKGDTFYAEAVSKINGKWKHVKMHREILGLVRGDGNMVDHKNRNGLDNRKSNMRLSTKSSNGYNCKMKSHNTSGYRGVHWSKAASKWQTRIGVNGSPKYLGCYVDIIEAASEYDKASIKFWGKDAILNFPEKREEYEKNTVCEAEYNRP
jgi:hypothetical protein